MMTGSYIGGGVNFVALADAFHTEGTLVSATVVADNLNMAVYFLVLLKCVSSAFFQKHYPHPHMDRVAREGREGAQTQAAAYWQAKNISLKDIALDLFYAVAVVTLSQNLGKMLGAACRQRLGAYGQPLLQQPICVDHPVFHGFCHLF